ncbi:amidohydrolase family protein [Pontibacter sp. G13]|uniref:amidohydrolase family protein n=1 Tax=Pontibacter sp. G13 TaxID=3074898 RepID=UPI00288B19D3|nr:amidohydrolase family protein [Pontibacter sp. G13]WNJ16282.1 amidohydrolase family protein [Pontibacter sp. G13]
MKFMTTVIRHIIMLGAVLVSSLAVGPMVQAQMSKGTFETVVLENATIVTVTQGTIQGDLLIQDGKIAAIGEVDAPEGTNRIDCTGKFIYPGMIDGGTRIGLAEIGAVNVTQDYREIGDITPHVQALTAVNPNSVIIPVTRTNGVTTALSVPGGGLFTGTAALVNLHGYTPNQMYAGFKAVVLNFPSSAKRGRWDRRSEEDIQKDLKKKLKTLNEVWDGAIRYAAIDSAYQAGGGEKPAYYPQMEALVPAVKGDAKLLIEVNAASDILAAIDWVQSRKVDAVFTGVGEGWRVAEELAEAQIPVVTGPILETPSRESDRFDRPYANAGLMHKAGVKVAIRTNEAENVRNLPFNAGFAAAYGMGKEEALKAVTIVPAEIFGLAEELGSIEVGKWANLFVSDGDPFEPKTQITQLFIKGWNIPIDSRHIRLYEEFLERDPGIAR